MRAPRRGPRGSTSPSARRTSAPRRTPWPPRRDRRCRPPRRACRAGTACPAARPRRRTRPGPGGGPRPGRARPHRTAPHRPSAAAHRRARRAGSPQAGAARPGDVGPRGERRVHDHHSGHPSLPPQVLTFRTPEDVLAAVPVLLGFEPSDSVVMLTFGGRETFHARIDMPAADRQLDEAVDLLLEPALRPRGRPGAARRLLGAGRGSADRLLDALGAAFARAGRPGGRHAACRRRPVVPAGLARACPTTRVAHPFRAQVGARRARGHRAPARSWPPGWVPSPAPWRSPRRRVTRVPALRRHRGGRRASGGRWRRGALGDDDLAGVLQGIRDAPCGTPPGDR